MPDQTVKIAWKDQITPNYFFSQKTLIKFSCTYQPLSFCKIFKKFLGLIQSYEDVPFLSPKWPTCPEQIFFWHKSLLLLSSTYWPFSLCKIFKNSYCESRVMRMHHFWAQNGPFAPNNFFWKIINIILIYLLAPFIVQNFKKILPADPELWGCAIFGPKMAHFPKWEFFQKTC